MKSETLINVAVLNWFTAQFLGKFEETRKSKPSTSVSDVYSAFVNEHPILAENRDASLLIHQGVALSLAYTLIVLPWESDVELQSWQIKIDSLSEFHLKTRPEKYFTGDGTTSEWLRYLRNCFAHGNVEINPQAGIDGNEAYVLWNCPEKNKPKNFEATCSSRVFMEFLDEFGRKFIDAKLKCSH